MKIALFDFVVAPHSGPGGCDVQLLQALDGEHEITVFASELIVPGGTGRSIEHIAVPAPSHPAVVSFLVYFARACAWYAWLRLRGVRFDRIQATDCSFLTADVCYAHLCHRAFLADVWPEVRGPITLRTAHAWAGHKVRAAIEARLVRAARVIVVPSEGLRRDLARVYRGITAKIVVIPNTVDAARYVPPSDFDRRPVRTRMSTDDTDTAFVFVALGHFERKGLPILLRALTTDTPKLDRARLWVVGGEPGLIATYRRMADSLGVGARVVFAGKTADVRPFLWSADALVAPSHYEAFSLALLEAAAAGLPLLATRISGSEDLLRDGVNGIEVERTAASVSAGLRRFLDLAPADRAAMGRAARESVEPLSPESFASAWRALYASLTPLEATS
jgi:glycosyltransferase involved in cell wall biosynthesis